MRVSYLRTAFSFWVNYPFKADKHGLKAAKNASCFFLHVALLFLSDSLLHIYSILYNVLFCVLFFLDLDEMSDKGSSEHEEGDQEGSTKASSPGSSSSVSSTLCFAGSEAGDSHPGVEQKSRHALHYSPTRWILPRLAHQIPG